MNIYRLKPIQQNQEAGVKDEHGVFRQSSKPFVIPFTFPTEEKAQEIMSKFPPGTYELIVEEK